ncbi:MAG TPA: formate dehydrogenase [Planctomycetes bacterium]|nr:formate dehydrogenase [Planctomycetota bacterium]
MARKRRGFWDLNHSLVPFGLGETKPGHFREMLRIIWQNRDNLPYAWKVLTRGVCDGCALGTNGLKDWTIEGTHLCMVRLELLRLNTMPGFDPKILGDVAPLQGLTSRELRELGRLPFPMRRLPGEPGFTRMSWDELWRDIGARWREADPDKTAMYVTSRGITNETYYTAGKVMRYLGSPHVDNSARLCHSPSTSGLKNTIGVAATTCSYRDFYESDLIVFFGSNPANDQPVATKYLEEAKKRGARILQVNTYREPGMKRYWVPSSPRSALFGTKLCDKDFLVRVGGDLAFLNAAAKILLEREAWKKDFIKDAVDGFEEWKAALEEQDMDDLCEAAGTTREQIEDFAAEVEAADKGIFVWSMGITQHVHGAETVSAIVNLGLLKEFVGRAGCGMMPIRGHSGVQGGAEMGAYATSLPGGLPVEPGNAEDFSAMWEFPVPSSPGMTTVEALEAAGRGELDALYCIGGDFLGTMPNPGRIERALKRIPLRIHSDIVVTKPMLLPAKEAVYLLPARTRYEQEGGGTETTTERRVIFSPYIPGHNIGEARTEWEMLVQLAEAVVPGSGEILGLANAEAVRADIAQAVPFYSGIEKLKKQGDQFQWGGPMLCTDREFPTENGKARLVPAQPPKLGKKRKAGVFLLATRRGKQFNSMVQKNRDPLTGAERDHVLMNPKDAEELGVVHNSLITLRSKTGEFKGRAFPAEVARGTLQGHWPEVNVLIPHGRVDKSGGVPDYNAEVKVEVGAERPSRG